MGAVHDIEIEVTEINFDPYKGFQKSRSLDFEKQSKQNSVLC